MENVLTRIGEFASEQNSANSQYGLVRSDLIKVFPCAGRGVEITSNKQIDSGNPEVQRIVAFNHEARMNTEYNWTHTAGSLTNNTYLIGWGTFDDSESIGLADETKATLRFVLNGYYFEVDNISPADLINNGDFYKYVAIKTQARELASRTSPDGLETYRENTAQLATWMSTAANLDIYLEKDSTSDPTHFSDYIFTGLVFTKDAPSSVSGETSVTYLQLFLTDGTERLKLNSAALPTKICSGNGQNSIRLNNITSQDDVSAKADGKNSIAGGQHTQVGTAGENGLAFGTDTVSNSPNLAVFGAYNKKEDASAKSALLIVGGGSDDGSRWDAFRVNEEDLVLQGVPLSNILEERKEFTYKGIDKTGNGETYYTTERLGKSPDINPNTGIDYSKYTNIVRHARGATKLVSLSFDKVSGTTATGLEVGSGINPVYFRQGEPLQSIETVGNAKQPIYLNGGEITALDQVVYSTSSGSAKYDYADAFSHILNGKLKPDAKNTTAVYFSGEKVFNDSIKVANAKSIGFGKYENYVSGSANTLTVKGNINLDLDAGTKIVLKQAADFEQTAVFKKTVSLTEDVTLTANKTIIFGSNGTLSGNNGTATYAGILFKATKEIEAPTIHATTELKAPKIVVESAGSEFNSLKLKNSGKITFNVDSNYINGSANILTIAGQSKISALSNLEIASGKILKVNSIANTDGTELSLTGTTIKLTGALTTTSGATIGNKLTVEGGGAAISGATTITGNFTVSGGEVDLSACTVKVPSVTIS